MNVYVASTLWDQHEFCFLAFFISASLAYNRLRLGHLIWSMHAALTAALGDPAPIKLVTALIQHGQWEHALTVLKHSEFNLLTHRTVCGALLQKLLDLLVRIPQCGLGPPDAAARLPGTVSSGKKARAAESATSAPAAAEFTPLMMQMLEVCDASDS